MKTLLLCGVEEYILVFLISTIAIRFKYRLQGSEKLGAIVFPSTPTQQISNATPSPTTPRKSSDYPQQATSTPSTTTNTSSNSGLVVGPVSNSLQKSNNEQLPTFSAPSSVGNNSLSGSSSQIGGPIGGPFQDSVPPASAPNNSGSTNMGIVTVTPPSHPAFVSSTVSTVPSVAEKSPLGPPHMAPTFSPANQVM